MSIVHNNVADAILDVRQQQSTDQRYTIKAADTRLPRRPFISGNSVIIEEGKDPDKNVRKPPSTGRSTTWSPSHTTPEDDYGKEDEGYDEDDSDDEVDFNKEEDLDDYRAGGYHPTKIGDVCGDKQQYQIVRKLGWGHFSTVWLASNTITKTYIALKIIKSADKYKSAAIDEIKLLRRSGQGSDDHPGKKHVVKLLDYFLLAGPNGEHVCMVFELLGENMLSLIYKFRDLYSQYKDLTDSTSPSSSKEKDQSLSSSLNESASTLSLNDSMSFGEASTNVFALDKVFKDYYGGLPLSLVKRISKQMLLALDYLHRECGLIHTDLKPENILIEIRNVGRVVELVRQEERIIRFHRRQNSSKSLSGISTTSTVNSTFCQKNNQASGFQSSNSIGSSPNKKKLSITTNLSSSTLFQDGLTTATRRNSTPIRTSKPLPSPILRKSSIWSCCYGEENSATSNRNDSRGSQIDTDSSISPFDRFRFTSESVENMSNSFGKLSVNNLNEEPSISNLSRQLRPSENPFDVDLGNLKDLRLLEDELEELDEYINIKIADLGNACFVDYHFTDSIQTREYRSPEILVQAPWGCSTDIWSAGCIVFELITGSFAFRPNTKTSSMDRDSEHLSKIIGTVLDEANFRQSKACYDFYDSYFFDEDSNFIKPDPDTLPSPPPGFNLKKIMRTSANDFLNTKGNRCGPFIFPYSLYLSSGLGKRFFNSMVTRLVRGPRVKFFSIHRTLVEKHHVSKLEAQEISDFIGRMLEIHPKYREDAGGLSNHPWLRIRAGAPGSYYEDDEFVDRPLGCSGEDIPGWHYEIMHPMNSDIDSEDDDEDEEEEEEEEGDDDDDDDDEDGSNHKPGSAGGFSPQQTEYYDEYVYYHR
ncbi:hypothetical protein DASC09_016630 [Saccharomycopsis crataegensis]|uniref:non-specific serine/threonine protein kinase n=1 Tax=Saccharomycopsis crataegensis TaxID=43959 RepID=A0AAV5QHK5_9ASCO|nr:hypothetical protein DASC09_016630 [Saccharomycopsis crataegensis]